MPTGNNRSTTIVPLLAAALMRSALFCRAAEEKKEGEVKCPSGIDHGAWNRLLKKYVDENGLVHYAAWKNNKEDLDALDTHLIHFAPKADKPAEGNEKAASLVNAYNAIAMRTILDAYPVESIHEVGKPRQGFCDSLRLPRDF